MWVSILDLILDSWFLCELRIVNREQVIEKRVEGRVSQRLFRFAESHRNGISRIKMQQSRNRVLILARIENRESSVALLLKDTVIIFDFYNVNQTFALTTFKHFDLLRYKFILNEGRSCHWEWYPENKPVESPFHYTVTGAVLCIFFCTNML